MNLVQFQLDCMSNRELSKGFQDIMKKGNHDELRNWFETAGYNGITADECSSIVANSETIIAQVGDSY